MPVILIELVLVLGVTLGIGLWQLYDVNKALKDGEKEKEKDVSSSGDAKRIDPDPADSSSNDDR